jgi:hypothetical protein
MCDLGQPLETEEPTTTGEAMNTPQTESQPTSSFRKTITGGFQFSIWDTGHAHGGASMGFRWEAMK